MFLEKKEDKEREIDPKLLFPLKEWLLSFLPGHTFKWDFVEEEERQLKKAKQEELMPIHDTVLHYNLLLNPPTFQWEFCENFLFIFVLTIGKEGCEGIDFVFGCANLHTFLELHL